MPFFRTAEVYRIEEETGKDIEDFFDESMFPDYDWDAQSREDDEEYEDEED